MRRDGEYVRMCDSESYACEYEEFRRRLVEYNFKSDKEWFEVCGVTEADQIFAESGVDHRGEIRYKTGHILALERRYHTNQTGDRGPSDKRGGLMGAGSAFVLVEGAKR
jgi:hypothetical protein